ncbi:YqzE family protein [Bacillus smithii]|uniref:YqzE family protein n=1 Tax=Bacillus smithii TaxID=1479 RepID=UPI0009D9EE78|nr:YqzE family protein [Bacillus smithii]MED0659181.1 YqzE family protein [Bacillus smithii]
MTANDLVKDIVKTFVAYLNQPPSKRTERRRTKKQYRPPFLYRWFGQIPYELLSIFKRK